MKTTITRFAWITLGLLLACLLPATTRAQAETHPEEYKGDNMAAVAPASAKIEFQGHFSLPYEVQCHGHKMVPGKYTLLVKTVGENKMVTLQREGSDVVLQSRAVPPTSVPDEGHSAVLLRHGPGPGGHTLEGVYVEDLKLVLFLDDSGHAKPLDKMFASVERVPIT